MDSSKNFLELGPQNRINPPQAWGTWLWEGIFSRNIHILGLLAGV